MEGPPGPRGTMRIEPPRLAETNDDVGATVPAKSQSVCWSAQCFASAAFWMTWSAAKVALTGPRGVLEFPAVASPNGRPIVTIGAVNVNAISMLKGSAMIQSAVDGQPAGHFAGLGSSAKTPDFYAKCPALQ